ncbi:MAG: 3-deoxy-D-manno-octulosonate 8-phosphate phosphatase [Chitinophagaceae bacterium]|nr:3-deoxy-D-manno-octulosonate 8-phosphate phosphatase [Chitinophagaceae bacterium]
MENILARFKAISTFVFDMDGVLTDGSLWIMPGGTWVRKMNIRDGYALQLAVKKGYRVLVISGSNSDEVSGRLAKLGITEVHMKVNDKAALLNEYLGKNNLQPAEVLCMGDDIPDLGMLQLSGLACCPADAATEIKEVSAYISPINGGEGCVRDVIEKVLKIRRNWNNDTTVPAT